jgi:L-fucose isomerase-like protein
MADTKNNQQISLHDRLIGRLPKVGIRPTIDGRPGGVRESLENQVMANWGANHGVISYGHIGLDLITLASMLRIPVCMHNVAEDKIFRPGAWNAFGMDPEGVDYRACKNFGPLHR